jgi:prephenate dehydratase
MIDKLTGKPFELCSNTATGTSSLIVEPGQLIDVVLEILTKTNISIGSIERNASSQRLGDEVKELLVMIEIEDQTKIQEIEKLLAEA